MANALIQPYKDGVGGPFVCPLYDPRFERENRQRFFREDIPDLQLCNSFYCVAGRWPCKGWILVRKSDYDQLDKYRTDFELHIDDLTHPEVVATYLSIVQAKCLSTGLIGDESAVYLVELTDRRGLIFNRWFQYPTTSAYNVRAPAYPGSYHDYSLNAGVPWTWDGLLANLWNQMGFALGTYPGLPTAPTSTPDGYIFPGMPCWLAFTEVLEALGCYVADAKDAAHLFSIVFGGAADAAFMDLQAQFNGLLEDDLQFIDVGSGRIPKQLTTFFHRRNQYYGTEETVRKDSFQWEAVPLYSVTKPAPAQFATAVGTAFVWDDFTVQFDTDGNALAVDVTTANTIATERVTDYFARIYRTIAGYMRQVYSGALPFETGSQVDGVAYRMDFQSGRKGWVTELIRGPQPPWPFVDVEYAPSPSPWGVS